MMRFYDSKGEQHPLSKNDVKNFYLQREADGSIRLCFDISSENRFYSQLVEESELEYDDNCYIVKKVKNGKIECDLNFDFLKRKVYKNYSSDSVLLMDLLSAHLPADWTVVNADVSGIRRTTAFEFCTDYDIVMSAMSTYGVYFEWSIKKKTVKVYLQSEAENTGEYLTDQLNLRKLSMQGDSLSLITRLYAYGKDGLSFASINNGNEYVDNTDYADKVVCGWWIDERYTVTSELLAATKEKIKTLSYPVRAYECDVVDLAKLNPKYSFLHFKLHKAVMLLDREHGIKVQHRIVRYKEYPYEPDRNVVTLSSVPQKISTRVNNLASSLEENKNLTNAYQKASVALSELISNSLGVYYTEIKDETGASQYYLHDEPLLENSSTIYTHNAGGYAFTNSGWNNGNPSWQYGFTKDGNAVFNKVCAYGLKVADPYGYFSAEISPNAFKIWQDGTLKLDASYNGLNIYDGSITIYKGAGYYSEKALYFDSDGNIALDGYLTQIGSSYRALIGSNEQGYGGFYLYNRVSPYLRDDGTYKPYLEVWTSTDNHTYIEGTNELKFGVSTIANESEGNFARVRIVPEGGYLYGAWDFGQEQFFSHTINVPAFICRSGSTKVLSFYISTTSNPCFNSDNGKDYFFSVAGTSRMAIRSAGGDMYGEWGINTDSGYVSLITDKTGNGGGKLWGTWYLGNSTAITSDVNKKNTIEDLSEKYSVLFDNLRPIRYKYNDGTSDRYHTGFIAQEVEQALTISEVDSSEFAGFVRTKDDECFLRYEEFIALAVKEIQSLKKHTTELERKLNSVLEKLEV